ncbi:MAG: LCP family protein [Oscillospiraceae bacterium]|nr:LCP family protein [Oscillospiraceae bacterium]
MSQTGRHSSSNRDPGKKAPRRIEDNPSPDGIDEVLAEEELSADGTEAAAAAGSAHHADGTHRPRKKNPTHSSGRSGSGSGGKKRRRRKKKKKGGWKVALLVILGVLLVLGIAGYAFFHHLYGLMDTSSRTVGTATPTPYVEVTPEPEGPTEEPEPTDTPEPTLPPLTEEELAAQAELELLDSLQEAAEDITYSEDVYNLLLIGADGTSKKVERGDAMLLLSINRATKKIWITSLMRDTQVSIYTAERTFYGTGHLNWTTQWGGVGMLVATIEDSHNFAVKIDNWALVNFVDFADIAGMLGPIEVTVTPAEAASMNELIRQVAQMRDKVYKLKKKPASERTPRVYFPEEGGTVEISDGIQILAYCRERKAGLGTENHYGDTGRSYKQREVLKLMWENVKKMSLTEQYALLEKVMSIITTDLTEGKCIQLLLTAPQLLTYDIETQQCPALGAMAKTRDANNLAIYLADWRVNRNLLRHTIYGEEMSRAELTSSYTGVAVYVGDPTA